MEPTPRVIGIAGWSGAGKTTLIARLIPALVRRGVSVSTVKHAHHSFDIDKPGKDSHTHRMAGATEVMVSSASRWALMHEHRGAPEPTLEELLRRLSPVDLVIVEGFKFGGHAKLEVYRAAVGKPLLCADDPHVVAVVSDAPVPGIALPRIDIDDADAVADFILAHCGLFDPLRPERGERVASESAPGEVGVRAARPSPTLSPPRGAERETSTPVDET